MSSRSRRRVRNPVAHLDGMTIPGSCCDTEVRVGPPILGLAQVTLAHDDHCDITDPAVQLRAALAFQAELERRAEPCTVIFDAMSGRMGIAYWDRDAAKEGRK